MGEGDFNRPKSLSVEIAKAKHVGGAEDSDGHIVMMPVAAEQAALVDSLAQRYSVLPSQILAEDSRIINLALIAEAVKRGE